MDSEDSEDSVTKDTTEATTPRTTRQWSDEVAAEEEHPSLLSKPNAKQALAQKKPRDEDNMLDSHKLERQKAFTAAVGHALSGSSQARTAAGAESRLGRRLSLVSLSSR